MNGIDWPQLSDLDLTPPLLAGLALAGLIIRGLSRKLRKDKQTWLTLDMLEKALSMEVRK